MRRFRCRRGSQGFTLVEILVASLLFFLVMAGIVPFFLTALGQSSTVRYKSLATNIARERMEQIRQLDCRDITTAEALAARFGSTETTRDIPFDITYGVEESTYDNELLKKVTVTVGWTGPPTGSAAALSTLVHQQFVGPRVSALTLSYYLADPLGTPFPCLYKDTPHVLICSVAQADWDLVFDNLDEPGMAPKDVYARLVLVDSNGQIRPMGSPATDYRLLNLTYTTGADGKVNAVFFPYVFDSEDIPDGYWEIRATIYNEYNEPGNVWRLRTRVENDHPGVPTDLVATAQADNETVQLVWSGGSERDRAYYVVERRMAVPWGWTLWRTVNDQLDPNATQLVDQGSVDGQIDPWGDPSNENLYQYRIRAVDICDPGKVGGEALTEVAVPPVTIPDTPVTTEPPTTTTTGAQLYSAAIDNKTSRTYSVRIQGDDGTDSYFTLDKRSTLSLTGLQAGNYLITASTAGRPTLTQSFSLPAQAEQTVMTIL